MSELAAATVVTALVTLSLPLYVYGAWIVIEAETVTWSVLLRHLRYIGAGLVLTTGPLLFWMLPRAFDQVSGLLMVHAFFGLQAYALLLVALTGIVRIFQAKRQHDLYQNPDPGVDISELHEHVDAWRWRLRVGVFGYLLCWIIAYLVGMARYALRYAVYF